MAPNVIGGIARAKPSAIVKHCKLKPTSNGKMACSASTDSGGSDQSLNPDNNRLPPGSGPNDMTPAQRERCYENCMAAGRGIEAFCEASCN
jgi:hypothetical protein